MNEKAAYSAAFFFIENKNKQNNSKTNEDHI